MCKYPHGLPGSNTEAIMGAFQIPKDIYLKVMSYSNPTPLTVVVTTVPRSAVEWRRKIGACASTFGFPFRLRFAVESSAVLFGLPEESIYRYPNDLSGNLLGIRTWIEQNTDADLISDDDPGTSYAGGPFIEKRTTLILACDCNASGAHRWGITPELHHSVWKFGIALAKILGVNYLGCNGSEATKGVFCNTKFYPLGVNRTVNGISAIIHGIRHRISSACPQEWAMMTGFANSKGNGTLTMMPLLRPYAVNPPAEGTVEQAHSLIIKECGRIVFKPGNTGGGKGRKNNAIFHAIDARVSTVEACLQHAV